jgi:molecular chaperone GrpE (heat shock protein)
MPDDIVTRLHKSCYCSPTAPLDHSCLAFAAADEIEELRRRLHDCNEYALRLQRELERCRDCS